MCWMILVFNAPQTFHGNKYAYMDRFTASKFSFQWTTISVTLRLIWKSTSLLAIQKLYKKFEVFWQWNSIIINVDIFHLLVRCSVTSHTTSGYFLAVFIVTKTPFPIASLGQLNVCTLIDALSGTFSICPQLVLSFMVNGFSVILPTSTLMLSIHSTKWVGWTEKISQKCTSLDFKLFCSSSISGI